MSLNKVILLGNVGGDPEVKVIEGSGQTVTRFNVATNRKFKTKDGETKEQSQWHKIVCWSRLAEICGQYVKKGMQILIEGEIQYREYTDKDGNKRFITEINAQNVQFLSAPKVEDEMQTMNKKTVKNYAPQTSAEAKKMSMPKGMDLNEEIGF